MFQSARFRLTAWYLVIIMAISIFFSAFIYIGATREFDRILRIQKMRLQHPEIHLKIIQGKPWAIESFPTPSQPDPQVEEEERLRVLESLLGVNIIILIISSLARKKNINISTNISETHYIMGDEKNLVELFVILLDNAIKYSPQKKNVSIASKRIDGKVVIAVEDAGIGIKREDIPHIFDRFYRVDESRTKQKTPGYGLGLSIAKRIVDMHKGTISVESEVGHGTVFTVTFPADKNLV